MASVGGIDLGGIWGGLGSTVSKTSSMFFWGLGILIVIGIFGYFAFRWYKNLTFYKTPVSLTVIMENGTDKTRNDLRGGVFWNRGIRDFKIKIPKSKPHVLGYMPDFEKSDAEGRLKFITTGDRTIWQQYESRWQLKDEAEDEEGNIFNYDLINKPVARETKQVTINSIKNWRDTIDRQKITAYTIAIGAFVIMVIAHLISLYIQTKIKCGAP